jgi:imidazolonepropionase-like amidohydrolase
VDDDAPAKPGDPPRAALVSVKEDGTDRRAHLRFALGEEAVVSPDGRFVVYNELHDAFVAVMPALDAQTIDLAATGAPVPVARLTDEGGEWVNWADGGKTVTWIYGPVYKRVALDKALPEPKPEAADDAEKKDDKKKDDKKKGEPKTEEASKLPEATAIEITLTLPRAKPSGTVAYTNARIVTMKGDEVLERGTIVVKDDRIASVGAGAPPAGAKVVDLAGTTIIPGLIDEHAHLHYSTLDLFPERPWKYAANLAYGITTTHDPSASTQEVFAQSEMVEAGLMTGPRIYSTGFILYGANLPGKAVIDKKEDAFKHLERLKSLGAFSVKSYMQPRRDVRQWILDAARKLDMLVVPEGGGDLETNVGMILDGHTTIEHALPISPLYKDVTTLFAKSGTAYTPTLLVAYGGISGDKWFHQHYDLWKDERLQKFVPQSIVDSLGRIRGVMVTDPADWHHLDVAASAKKIVDAGGRVCLGGHGQMQGLGPHWELWAFVQGGMTPMQALRVGTLYPAQTLGLDRDLGSIEAGKLADFVVLDKNPLEKIENTETVRLVVKNGRAYTPDELALPKR